MKNQPLKLGEKTAQYPYGYGFCQCGCGEKTPESSTGVYPMYLSRKNRPANTTDHEMVKLYEQEQRNTLGKMRTITHEVELVAKMVKSLWNSSPPDKQLALEKLIGILDALNSLRYQQRELIKKPDGFKHRTGPESQSTPADKRSSPSDR